MTPPTLLFGLGGEAGPAMQSRLIKEGAPIRMLSSWYAQPGDLAWMATPSMRAFVADTNSKGYSHHLIVFPEEQSHVDFKTYYGKTNGARYPLSDRFLGDMHDLARTFAGGPATPFYVTLFTEFQTYCGPRNTWERPEDVRYFRALKDQYRAARAIFRGTAANAKVSLGWGGWQSRRPELIELFGHFSDVLERASDFHSFQAMPGPGDTQGPQQIQDMTRILHGFGNKPVMLAHYLPLDVAQARADYPVVFTDPFVQGLVDDGLFALSFMDDRVWWGDEQLYVQVKNAVTRYAA